MSIADSLGVQGAGVGVGGRGRGSPAGKKCNIDLLATEEQARVRESSNSSKRHMKEKEK